MTRDIQLTTRDIQLTQLLVEVRQHLGSLRGSALDNTTAVQYIAEELALRLRGHVLAHQLPPQTRTTVVEGNTEDLRHATWWDHFKATHRGRWWMRWRAWTINYTTVAVPYRHPVTVTVRDHWSFPDARIYPRALGAPVMITLTEVGR